MDFSDLLCQAGPLIARVNSFPWKRVSWTSFPVVTRARYVCAELLDFPRFLSVEADD